MALNVKPKVVWILYLLESCIHYVKYFIYVYKTVDFFVNYNSKFAKNEPNLTCELQSTNPIVGYAQMFNAVNILAIT